MKASKEFHRRARQAIADPHLQAALDRNATRRRSARITALASLPDPEAARRRAAAIRQHTIENLPRYLGEFAAKVEANGINVHHAANAREAVAITLELARQQGAQLIAKSKSMVTEEIGLNAALEAAGMRVVETDLGEYIVQLRGEHPTHIITPAVHLRREEVAQTFHEQLDVPYSTDVGTMTQTARSKLREVFLSAPIGISGVNFGVVESGTLCLVTNEGNGRLVTTLPQTHIAIMGVERLLPTLEDLALMLQLLPRSATGQQLTSYIKLINAPRQESDPDGPRQRHLILVDNGRLAMAQSPLAEALRCIRCGACLNACPVYQEVGGRTYGSAYQGPIGALVSPGLYGSQAYGHLSKASTLCGACTDACPVEIDFPKLLLRARGDYIREVRQPPHFTQGLKAYSWLMNSPARYRWGQRLAALAGGLLPRKNGWLRWLPPPLNSWTHSRHFPAFAKRPFRQRWGEGIAVTPAQQIQTQAPAAPQAEPQAAPLEKKGPVEQFSQALCELGGEVVLCSQDELATKVIQRLEQLEARQLLTWVAQSPLLQTVNARLREDGYKLLTPELDWESEERQPQIDALAEAHVGLTGAGAAIAESGTLVLPAGSGRSQLASLLPPIHLAILSTKDIYLTLEAWLREAGNHTLDESATVDLISGPSRTADIEMTLTVGVHGPGDVIVFCVED